MSLKKLGDTDYKYQSQRVQIEDLEKKLRDYEV